MDKYLTTGLWDPWGNYGYSIVPVDEPSGPRTPTATTNAPSYETPWWVDTINRGIERAAQVATLEVAGYPPYPSYPTPTPTPAPVPMPMPVPAPGVQPQATTGLGFQISPTTALLVLALGFAFFSGRGRR
jgi:hypothetical protein